MNENTEQAVLAGGCFWCTEAVFDRLRGVQQVESGYCGGHVANPTYAQVCTGGTGHAEVIRIHFDPSVIGYDDLLDIFMATHNPTQLNRQGNDIGPQYRSAVFPQSKAQETAAEAAIARAGADWEQPIVTTIEPAGTFWPAEQEHRNYFARTGDNNPYCTVVISPKVAKFMHRFADRLKPPAP